jgi:hypothetical protein
MKTKPHKIRHAAEQIFADILKQSQLEFVYQPATFHFNGISYTPDFYVPKDQTFYEVIGTRQAYSLTRQKINLLEKVYPFLKICIVNPDGTNYESRPIRKSIEPLVSFTPLSFHNWDAGKCRGLDAERRGKSLSRAQLFVLTGITPTQQKFIISNRHAPMEAIDVLAQTFERSPEYIKFLIEQYPTIEEMEKFQSATDS